MYTTCLFCKRPLPSNEVVEEFPVGRRLAFDPAKGRLWVVCRRCRRWNLTPLEERWEAIETCERIFRDTPMRASTDNIGIARHREGLDLVRIGEPPRGEFAAWRYGTRFGIRRWRSHLAGIAGGLAGGTLGPISLPIVGTLGFALAGPYLAWNFLRPIAKVRVGGEAGADGPVAPESVVKFRRLDVRSIRMLPGGDAPGFRVEIDRGLRRAWFEGEDARRVAAAIVPLVNREGGARSTVRRAVDAIETSGHPTRFLADVVNRKHSGLTGRTGYVRAMPTPLRLAVEMSLHEEQERRALEGELWILEQAWREAEEIAAIADKLLLPAHADEFFERHGKPEEDGGQTI
ncbi:MAG: hypothetical protein F4143_02215 [Gemmatimonadales bacterium]|nr:hypothetical protein [Gemmatimonadales bacterium]